MCFTDTIRNRCFRMQFCCTYFMKIILGPERHDNEEMLHNAFLLFIVSKHKEFENVRYERPLTIKAEKMHPEKLYN